MNNQLQQIFVQEFNQLKTQNYTVLISNDNQFAMSSAEIKAKGNWFVIESVDNPLLNKDKQYEEHFFVKMNVSTFSGSDSAIQVKVGDIVQGLDFSSLVFAVRQTDGGLPQVNLKNINLRITAGKGTPNLITSRTGRAVRHVSSLLDIYNTQDSQGVLKTTLFPPSEQIYIKKDRVILILTGNASQSSFPAGLYGVNSVFDLTGESVSLFNPNTEYPQFLNLIDQASGYPFTAPGVFGTPFGRWIDTLSRRNAQVRFLFPSLSGFSGTAPLQYGLMAGVIDYQNVAGFNITWVPIGQAAVPAQGVPGIIDVSRGTYDLLTDYIMIPSANSTLAWSFSYSAELEAGEE